MSCYECHKVQEIALNKNNPNTVGIAYIRVEDYEFCNKWTGYATGDFTINCTQTNLDRIRGTAR